MSKFFMGVDPGATGAAAFIDEAGRYFLSIDYPGDPVSLVTELDLRTADPMARVEIALAVIEQVHALPRQGVSSTFKFGVNFGIWLGVLSTLKIPHEIISPNRWRKILDSSVPAKPEKEDLRQFAIRRFPSASEDLKLKKHHGRAEALLMATYARQKYLGLIR